MKIGLLIVLSLFFISCSNQAITEDRVINNYVAKRYISNNVDTEGLDKYSYILDVKTSEVFNKKINGEYKSVSHLLLKNNVVYIKLHYFDKNVVKGIKDTLNKYKVLSGVVLDLRDNPGGLLEEAVGVVDLFIGEGLIIRKSGRLRGENIIYVAHKYNTLSSSPMVVLVNEKSASASEIVAGALQIHKRAIVLGNKTFGKGSIQDVIQLPNEKILKLTVAKYVLDGEKEIEGVGIVPDLMIKNKKLVLKSTEQHVEKVYKYINPIFVFDPKMDNFLILAVKILSGNFNFKR